MFKCFIPAALLLAAVPAAAQPQPTPAPAPAPPAAQPQPAPQPTPPLSAPEAAIQRTAQAFGQCVSTGMRGLAATVTPEAGAARVLAGCASQRRQLEQAAEAMIAGASIPEEQRAAARQQVRERFASMEGQIATAIRQSRAAPAAPSPAPAPTPRR